MEQKTTSSMPISIVDSKSSLELAQTKDVINHFWIDFCGLQIIKHENKETYQRVSKPRLTYEFAKDVTSNIYLEINRITARTTFTNDQIELYLFKQSEIMCDWFAVEGIKNLVSPAAWEKCLELAQPDNDAEHIEQNGQKIVPNKWYTKHQIYWNYNEPFNIDMLNIIKRDYGLGQEQFDQAIIMRQIFWSIRVFIHGGLNRSKDHLTLDHEKVIHKENTTFSGTTDRVESEGMLERFKNKIQQMGSGQR